MPSQTQCPTNDEHVSADGRHIIKPYDVQPGSDIGQCDWPTHLAVDNNEFVFVADVTNRRVTLLSPTLDYIRQVVSRDDLKGAPATLYLDIHTFTDDVCVSLTINTKQDVL